MADFKPEVHYISGMEWDISDIPIGVPMFSGSGFTMELLSVQRGWVEIKNQDGDILPNVDKIPMGIPILQGSGIARQANTMSSKLHKDAHFHCPL